MSFALPDLDAAGLPTFGLVYRVASTGAQLPNDPRIHFDLSGSLGSTVENGRGGNSAMPGRRRGTASWPQAIRTDSSKTPPPVKFNS